jgi:hypothetical protein
MRIWRAHEAQVKHFAHFYVISEPAAPAQKPVFLLARQRLPYPILIGVI